MLPLSLALALWLAGAVVLARVLRRRASAGLDHGGDACLSVIIPARNEEQNLPRLLRSIRAQPCRPPEVIVVDDGSTDRTAAVARELGATVLAAQPLPDGWRGKTWACHQGAQAATGELLLFLDADTWIEPGGLRAMLAIYPGGAFSVGPYHAVEQPYEQLSAFFNLVMVAGTVPERLFGQVLLIDRESYRRVGGHKAVRGRTLENLQLATRLRAAGIAVRSRAGKGMLAFRMYPNGLAQLIEGWTKGFASGAGQTPLPVLLSIVAWLSALALAAVELAWNAGTWNEQGVLVWAGVYLLFASQLAISLRRLGAFRWSTALLYPVALFFYFSVFARSLLRSRRHGAVTWKGRTIDAD